MKDTKRFKRTPLLPSDFDHPNGRTVFDVLEECLTTPFGHFVKSVQATRTIQCGGCGGVARTLTLREFLLGSDTGDRCQCCLYRDPLSEQDTQTIERSKVLLKYRQNMGWSPAMLAKQCGVTEAQYRQVEDGRSTDWALVDRCLTALRLV